jgi:membrane-associated protease RseP (regulator of RpoE activity)
MATPAMLQDDMHTTIAPPGAVRGNRYWINIALFLLTFLTTTMIGMRYMLNFQQGHFPLFSDADVFPFQWVFANLSRFALGLPFSITLLAILVTHEFGHYIACSRHKIRSSLPFFIPAPSLSGTAGAVIRLQSPVPSRAALITVGAAGPCAGFLVAIAASILGLWLSKPVAAPPIMRVHLQTPLLFRLLQSAAGKTGPLLWHPVYLASWIGLLITSLNLIPAGQLDGGHILYALSPRAHRIGTRIVIAALILLGIQYWLGWLLWAAILCLPGMRHPSVYDTRPLSRPMRALAVVSLVILLLTAIPRPFTQASLLAVLHQLH